MKKLTVFLLFLILTLFLCSCGQRQPDQHWEFPETSWGMNMEEVMNALNIQKEEISYIHPTFLSTLFHMEDYKLFGTRAESIDFHFLNFEAYLEEDIENKLLTIRQENQGLFDQNLYDDDVRLFQQNPEHKFCAVDVNYADNTDMEQVLAEMKKIYGDTFPHVTVYETQMSSMQPKEYKNSEQIHIWGTDVLDSRIAKKDSEAYRDGWKHYNQKIDQIDWADWDLFIQNARMEWILWINEENNKKLRFMALHEGIYRTLQEQISAP